MVKGVPWSRLGDIDICHEQQPQFTGNPTFSRLQFICAFSKIMWAYLHIRQTMWLVFRILKCPYSTVSETTKRTLTREVLHKRLQVLRKRRKNR